MYIMKTSKEFASLDLTVNEVVKGLNKYFNGPSGNDVCFFYDAEMDYTYCYSPKCCLAAAILWLHEQRIDYYCGMPLSCEKEKEQEIQVKVRNVLSTDISIEPDSLPVLDVKMALWDGSFDSVLIDSICEDLIHYISKYGEEKKEDSLCELAEKYNALRTGLINALGAEPYTTGYQLICKVSSLYYFRREVQRKLGCLGQSDADTMPVLLRTIDKAKCFEDMDKQYMETTKSLCEIAEIIERLQK